MSESQSDSHSGTTVKERQKVKHPKQYKVILLNDDYTSMDFVISILETIFMKSPAEAMRIMLQVHNQGLGICGVFSKQIAEAKAELVHQRARADGYPLRCLIEEV